MGVTLFARPPSSLFFPKPKSRRRDAPSAVGAPAEANGRGVISFQGKSLTEKAALKWLSRLQGSSKDILKQPCISPLLIGQDETRSSSQLLSQNSDSYRFKLAKAAQKLTHICRKSRKKQDGHLLDLSSQKPGNRLTNPSYEHRQLASESREDLARVTESASIAHGKGRGCDTTRASRAGDGDDESLRKPSVDNLNVRGRSWQPSARWLPYAAGAATLASAAAALKGIQFSSAHASVVPAGGGNGHQPPPGSGDGGGGGGGDNGGFNGGSSGESFFGDLIYDPRRKQEEEQLPRSVSIRKRIPEKPSGEASEGTQTSTRRARTLASLSSAAGDLIDGEGPIGGGMMSRGSPEVDHNPKRLQSLGSHLGPYSAALPFDGSRGGPRESMVRKYGSPSDPFFSGDGSSSSQDRPSSSPSSQGTENRADASRGRDAFDPSVHSPSGKPQQPRKIYAQANELNKAPDNNYYTYTSSRDSHQVPDEFSSLRGKITEIPGYEGGGRSTDKQHDSAQKTDFSGWVGGLVHSIVGKRTGGPESGTGDQMGDDDERKALVTEVASRTLQLMTDKSSETGLAKSSETGALRRLQRETFSDLLKIRERLDKLEHLSGLRRGKSSGDALAGVQTRLKGEVNSGGAFVLVEDLTSNLSRFALQHAGMMTGLDVRFTFETQMRESDVLITQCGVGQVSGECDSSILGGPVSLQKINYVAQINDTLSLVVAPLGARASDMADTVNHLQGQALTAFAGSGPALFQHCRGSAISASLRSSSVLLSMSQFLSGWGNRAADATSGPLCLSTLAQFMVQPSEHMVFSLSAVNNLWPSPPLPSSSGCHWSEMGPLVFCKSVTRPTQPTGTFTVNDLPSSSSTSFFSQVHVPERDSWSLDAESREQLGSSGTAMQSVAFSGEVDLGGNVSLGGWAQVERADWLEELEKKDFQWNLSLAKSNGPNVNWGLSVGRRKREDWGEDGSASPGIGPLEPSSSQLQMEAFVKLKVGHGFTLQPGLVYILDKYIQTPAFMVRSSWTL